jgi:Na+/melibiose symporter-like transporter
MTILNIFIAAYIDPNTGGMLFQILAVLFGVISGALLLFSGKIKGFYYRLRRRVQGSENEPSDVNEQMQEDE